MECGHSCESFCHVYEITETNKTGHDHIRCNKLCVRPRDCGHVCKNMCYECKGKEKPCEEEVEKKLECGHTNAYYCKDVSENNICKKKCEKILGCGHRCKKLCKDDCDKLYDSDIKKGYLTPCKEYIK
jgi:hypothetical protein